MRIAHLTSAHPRYDARIFLKECRSLSSAGHEVHLVVSDGRGDEVRNGVSIVDAGRASGRVARMLNATRRVMSKARELDADVYHLHDPELIPGGLLLKRTGKAIVFDAHEDLPRQLLTKPYLNSMTRGLLSHIADRFERRACAGLDGIIAATPCICRKFLEINPFTENVSNYPIIGELDGEGSIDRKREPFVVYAGSISATRGAREMVDAMALTRTGAKLLLAGNFAGGALAKELAGRPGWSKVEVLGHLSRDGLRSTFARAVAGLVTLHPFQAYLDALPIKLFEYMSAGLPVIGSNFPGWRHIIEANDCGICVNPLDPAEIARAIDQLVAGPERAEDMGKNGRNAVKTRYNWAMEEAKLVAFYSRLEALKSENNGRETLR